MIRWKIVRPLLRSPELSNKLFFILKSVFLIKNIFNNVVIQIIFANKLNFLFTPSSILSKSIPLQNTFKSMFKLDPALINPQKRKTPYFNKKDSSTMFSKDLFKSFMHLNTLLPTPKIEPHASFNSFYIYNKASNVGFFNVKKVLHVWHNIIIFITNLFFYNLKHVAFGSSYFKKEIVALNWHEFSFMHTSWRYTHAFMYFFKNKTTRANSIYFDYLTRCNYRIAFIIDMYYHSRTIYYCNKFKVITIGPVPISSNFYSLSIALPVSSNMAFSSLFFLRLVFKLKTYNASLIFHEYFDTK